MKHPLVRCGPYLSHILTSALVLGKTGHTHRMFTKLSTATGTFHKIAYFSHSACTARKQRMVRAQGTPPLHFPFFKALSRWWLKTD